MESKTKFDENSFTKSGFSRNQINSLILEYLILEGFYEAACQFSKDTGIHFNPESFHMNERLKIIEMVMNTDIENCILEINTSFPEFFDRNPDIYFQLRQLKMLEYIRSKQIMEALKFAQVYFADAVCKVSDKNCKMLNELQKTMTLLAFDNPMESPNGYLLKRDFTKIVAGNLNLAIMRYIIGGDCDDVSSENSSRFNYTGPGSILGSCLEEQRQFVVDPIPKLTQMMALMMQLNSQAGCKINFPEEFYVSDNDVDDEMAIRANDDFINESNRPDFIDQNSSN